MSGTRTWAPDSSVTLAVTGVDAIRALRAAAAHHTRPDYKPQVGQDIAVAVFHGPDVLLPRPGGVPDRPTTTAPGETCDQAALRTVREHTGHPVVVTSRTTDPATGRLIVTCALPARTSPGAGTLWAPAASVPGLAPLPPARTDNNNNDEGGNAA
jgi:hypothetical protein